MFTLLADRITNYLICKNTIDDDNREIYQYGLEQIFTTALNILTTLVLGIIFGKIYQGIVFVVAFMTLRSYSGGYHASTSIRCYIFSVISIVAGLSVMKLVEVNRFVCLVLLILSSIIILVLSPIETVNKPLDEIEKIIYKKKVIFVWSIEVCIALLFIVLNITEIHISIVLAQMLIGVALILGRLQYPNFREM